MPAENRYCLNLKIVNPPLTLTLLVTRIFADYAHDALAFDYLAIAADTFNRCQYFHIHLPA